MTSSTVHPLPSADDLAWIDYLLANNPHLKYTESVALPVAKQAPEPVAFAQTQSATPVRVKPTVISPTRQEVPKEITATAASPLGAGAAPLAADAVSRRHLPSRRAPGGRRVGAASHLS